MPTATDAVWVDVLPSMRNFRKEFDRQLKGAMPKVPAPEVDTPTIPQPDTKGWGARLADGLRSAGRQTHRALDDLGGQINKRLGTAMKIGAAGVGVTAGLALWGGLQRTLDTEDARKLFGQLGLGIGEIDDLMGDLQDTFETGPFAYPDVYDISSQLAASGVPLEDLVGATEAVGNMAAFAGEDLSRVGEVTNVIGANGRVMASELNRLGQMGIPIRQILAEALGITGDELSEMVSAGELSSEMFFELIGDADQFSGAMESFGSTTRGAWDIMKSGIAGIGEALLSPWFGEDGDMANFLGKINDLIFDRVQPAVANLGETIRERLVPVLQTAGEWIRDTLVPALQTVWGWFQDNSEMIGRLVRAAGPAVLVIGGLASAVHAVGVAMRFLGMSGPVLIIMALATAFVYAWQNSETFRNVVTTAFDVISKAVDLWWNYYVKPVFNAFVSWMRDVVAPAALWLWHNVLEPAWAGIRTAIRVVVEWLRGTAWPFIRRVWDNIRDSVETLWDRLQLAWDGIRLAVAVAVEAIRLYWRNILKPVWDAIADAAQWLWRNILQPVFESIEEGWGQILRGIERAWTSVLKPVWDAVASAAEWLWERVLRPVFGWIEERWDETLTGMKWVYDNVLKPMFDAFGRGIDTLRSGVARAVDGIRDAWNGIQRAFAAPVNWVIDEVINPFLGWVNDIAERIDVNIRFAMVPNVSWGSPARTTVSRPGGGFNRGGLIPGGGPDRDSVFAHLTPGEYVWSRSAVNNVGAGQLEQMHEAARRGEPLEMGDGPGWLRRVATSALSWARGFIVDTLRPGAEAAFDLMDRTVGQWGVPGQVAAGTSRKLGNSILDWAAGIEDEADRRVPELSTGVGWKAMWAAVQGAFPWARLTSAYRPGAITATGNPSYHGMGRAIDVAGMTPMNHPQMLRIARWIAENYPNSRELIYSRGPSMINGDQSWSPTGVTRRNHFDHVHWAYDQGGMLPPGVSQVANWTGKPEAVLTDQQWKTLSAAAGDGGRPVEVNVQAWTDRFSWSQVERELAMQGVV